MSKLPFKFPILLIPGPNDGDRWQDRFGIHCDDSSFTVVSDDHVRQRLYVGQTVFDASGRSWRLDDLVDLGLMSRSVLGRFLGRIFSNTDIRYQLSEELDLSFSEVKERVLAVIAAGGEAYSRGESAIEDYDPSKSNGELLDEFMTQVRNSERPLELIAVVYFHDLV